MSETEEAETKPRNLTQLAVGAIALAIGCFHLANVSGLAVVATREVRILHLMAMLAILFLTVPSLKRLESSKLDRVVGLALSLLSIASCFYLLTRWRDIAMSGGATTPLDTWVGGAIILLVLEASRRGVGLALAIITTVFVAYPFYCELLPGIFYSRGYGLARISEYLTSGSQGLFGIPLGVSATYIVLFTIYGAFLSAFGAGDFFFRLANRLTKGLRAAGAKTAVIFSTLLGMISGSAAGNVAVTGSLTIPMMKREGYAPHQAGAIEAVVSTGGQIMPPVMGAAAFIMAEIVGISYSSIMIAALIPALLFFISIFFVVHLQACKNEIAPYQPEEDDDEPLWLLVIKGGQYIIPFAALVVLMLGGFSPFKASFLSILILLACHIIWTRKLSLELFEKSGQAIIEGVKAVVPIAIACAAAGMIAGILGVTGLGSKISSLIISGSGGYILLALIFTMITAIILGMGLPTTAAYLILATVVAPALAKMGVPILTAHLFVFFYGCVSTITPPVALASYVAGGIAGADINKVGWTGFAYGITCFILPFMFVYGPGLLMQGSAAQIALAVTTGAAGVFALASAIIGYMRGALAPWQRAVLAAAAILLLLQGWASDLGGAALLTAMMLYTKAKQAPLTSI